jgi:hypothetical protein
VKTLLLMLIAEDVGSKQVRVEEEHFYPTSKQEPRQLLHCEDPAAALALAEKTVKQAYSNPLLDRAPPERRRDGYSHDLRAPGFAKSARVEPAEHPESWCRTSPSGVKNAARRGQGNLLADIERLHPSSSRSSTSSRTRRGSPLRVAARAGRRCQGDRSGFDAKRVAGVLEPVEKSNRGKEIVPMAPT